MHSFFKGHFDFSSEYVITFLIFYSKQKDHFSWYLNLINISKDQTGMARIRQAKLMEKGRSYNFPPIYTHAHLLVANAVFVVDMYFQVISNINASQVFNRESE